MKIQELHAADRSRNVVQENESGRLGWLGYLVGKGRRDVGKLLLAGNHAGKRRQDKPQSWWLDDVVNE
jgi:hypothetical protein